MLYVFCGDRAKAKGKARELAAALLKKKPDASVFELTSENWNEGAFEEYLGGQGLFERKYIIVLQELFTAPESTEKVSDFLKEIAASDNVFILVEGELTKKELGKLEKHAQKIHDLAVTEVVKKKEFNVFALTDAISRRDALHAWVIFTQAQMEGIEAEQVHGLIAWQLKSIALAHSAKDAKTAGLNPFVFSKAQSAARKFSQQEVQKLYTNLIDGYHQSRRGGAELALFTEQFLLSL